MPKVKASLSENSRMKEMQDMLSADKAEEVEESENSMKISDLKNLILLGKLTEEFKISGFTFKISTLSASEQANLMKVLMRADEMDRVLHSKAIAVSYCVKEINSVPLSELSEEHEGETVEDRNVSFILDMQSTLVEKIFREYESLVERSGKDVGFDTVKK